VSIKDTYPPTMVRQLCYNKYYSCNHESMSLRFVCCFLFLQREINILYKAEIITQTLDAEFHQQIPRADVFVA